MRDGKAGADSANRGPRVAALLLAAAMAAASAFGARAEIVNTATASGDYAGQVVTSAPSSQDVPVSAGSPAFEVSLTGRLEDEDGRPGAGDVILWQLTVENRGNVTLKPVTLAARFGRFECEGGEAARIDALAPGQTGTCVGRYTVSRADVDEDGGGDGDIDNLVFVSAPGAGTERAEASVVIRPVPDMRLSLSVEAWRQLFPGTYEIRYGLRVENSGTLRLGAVTLEDDLAAAFGEAAIVAGPWLQVAGFADGTAANPDFDGVSDKRLLADGARLSPGEAGNIQITVRVAAGPGTFRAVNRVTGTARELPGPVLSDDPQATPEIPSDGNPTVLEIADSDGDGVLDAIETTDGDRDGDGIADPLDFDPTGHFYCQTNGRIMAGGSITIDNLSLGGSQSGTGSSNGITILRDGSDGRYHFQVTEAGSYRLRYRLPPGGIASIDRKPDRPLSLASRSGNPVVLGSGEMGATGALADFSRPANPFHLEFSIDPGNAAILNNNIPLRFCGTPRLVAEAEVLSRPVLQGDGRSRVAYRLTARNVGDERVDEVRMSDSMAAAFGGDFEIVSARIASAPVSFAATVNPFFDGRSRTALLTSGGNLDPGEQVVVEVTLLAAASRGKHVNRVTVAGISPLDASAIRPESAEAVVAFGTGAEIDTVRVDGSAEPELAGPGATVGLAFEFAAPTAPAPRRLDLVVQTPAGLAYLPGSALIGDEPAEPVAVGGELAFRGVAVPAGGAQTLRLQLAVSATATTGSFAVYAFAREPDGGAVASEIGAATVRRDSEAVFDCAEIVGQIFDDRNRDGYVQQGEPGIAGVRVRADGRFLATTDLDGRFVIPCPMIPRERIGSRVMLQFDAESLPAGFRPTTPQAQSVQLERGKVARLSFGAASQRVVTHILDERSFEPGSTRLRTGSLRSLANLINVLEEEISVLRITYIAGRQDELAAARIEAAKALVAQAWEAKERPYGLAIETRVIGGG